MKVKLLAKCLSALFVLQACSQFESQDISAEIVQILSPSDSLFSPGPDIAFWWENNDRIEKYRFQVVTPDYDNPTLVLDTTSISNALYLSLVENVYTWQVKGVNEGSETNYARRVFIVDQTQPFQSSMLYPQDNDTLNNPAFLSLKWSSSDPAVSGIQFPVSDSIYLYKFPDTTSPFLSLFRDFQSADSADISGSLPQNERYRWHVVSFDKAGNKRRSNDFEFEIQ